MDQSKVQSRLEAAVSGRGDQLSHASQFFSKLVKVMADLKGPGGCPWDREQSLASLRQYVREEADEVCSAIDDILAFENKLREQAGLELDNPAPPGENDGARNETKGLSIAHHPHREGFNPHVSASGAPLPGSIPEHDGGDLDKLYAKLQDELGDLMLQSVFQAEILHHMGRGGIEAPLRAISDKLIRRHPHVYGDVNAEDSSQVLENWQKIKESEQ